MAPGYSMKRGQAGEFSDALGKILLGNLGLDIHMAVTWMCNSYLKIVVDQIYGHNIS